MATEVLLGTFTLLGALIAAGVAVIRVALGLPKSIAPRSPEEQQIGRRFAWIVGVFLSTNNGTSWTAVNADLAYTTVNALAVSPNGAGGTNLLAGTAGGVWRRPLSEMITSVKRLSTDLPTHFSLDQNYPNPFNPATRISFSLPSESIVSLKVFDALGREVSILLADELPAGSYARQWNAAALPGGVYFYRLVADAIPSGQAGSFTETKKLLLLR
jgi:hypothetical protein